MTDDFDAKAKKAVARGFVEGIVLFIFVCILFGVLRAVK